MWRRQQQLLSRKGANLSETTTPHDAINHPPHYSQGSIECIDAIEAAMSPDEFRGLLKGNVIKYLWRCDHKGGLQDLRKARWYLDRLILAESKGGE